MIEFNLLDFHSGFESCVTLCLMDVIMITFATRDFVHFCFRANHIRQSQLSNLLFFPSTVCIVLQCNQTRSYVIVLIERPPSGQSDPGTLVPFCKSLINPNLWFFVFSKSHTCVAVWKIQSLIFPPQTAALLWVPPIGLSLRGCTGTCTHTHTHTHTHTRARTRTRTRIAHTNPTTRWFWFLEIYPSSSTNQWRVFPVCRLSGLLQWHSIYSH